MIQYDLNRIIERVNKEGLNYKTTLPKEVDKTTKKVENIEYITLDEEQKLFSIIDSISDDTIVAFDTETTDLDTKNASLVGFSFCFENSKAYYVPIAHNYLGVTKQLTLKSAKEAIGKLNSKKLVLQNFKYDYSVIKNQLGLELKLYADSMILAWLLNSSEKVGLDALAFKYFDHKMIAFKDVVKKGENFSNVDIIEATKYAAEDALYTYKIYFRLLEEFKNIDAQKLVDIAHKYEFDFIYVLEYMESNGIKVDTNKLKFIKDANSKYLQTLTSKIYESSGSEFNINI